MLSDKELNCFSSIANYQLENHPLRSFITLQIQSITDSSRGSIRRKKSFASRSQHSTEEGARVGEHPEEEVQAILTDFSVDLGWHPKITGLHQLSSLSISKLTLSKRQSTLRIGRQSITGLQTPDRHTWAISLQMHVFGLRLAVLYWLRSVLHIPT